MRALSHSLQHAQHACTLPVRCRAQRKHSAQSTHTQKTHSPRASKPRRQASNGTHRVPLHTQMEQLLQECSSDRQHEPLPQLTRLAELWGLWDTAQGHAAAQHTLAQKMPIHDSQRAPSKHTQPPSRPTPALSRHAKATNTAPSPSFSPAPPADTLTRMEACARNLLHMISQHVLTDQPATANTISQHVLTDQAANNSTITYDSTVTSSSSRKCAEIANNTNTPHLTLDIDTACALAHAMATTHQYHDGLCAHIEQVAVQHASQALIGDTSIKLRHVARIMASWAKLGYVPAPTSVSVLLRASGAVMLDTAASLRASHALSPVPSSIPTPQAPSAAHTQLSPQQQPLPPHKLQATASPTTIAAASSPSSSSAASAAHSQLSPQTQPLPPHKLQAAARAVADLAWAASQLNVVRSSSDWISNNSSLDGSKHRSFSGRSSSNLSGSDLSSSSDLREEEENKSSSPSPSAPLNAALLLLPQHTHPSTFAAENTTAPSSAGSAASTAPVELVREQHEWLEALEECSLSLLPALNLAGLARLLQATATMRMQPQSHAWLHAAAARLLTATPEIQPASLSSKPELHSAPQISRTASSKEQPSAAHNPAPQISMTAPRLAGFTDALEGLALLWLGASVVRSATNRKGVLRLLPGSPVLEAVDGSAVLDRALMDRALMMEEREREDSVRESDTADCALYEGRLAVTEGTEPNSHHQQQQQQQETQQQQEIQPQRPSITLAEFKVDSGSSGVGDNRGRAEDSFALRELQETLPSLLSPTLLPFMRASHLTPLLWSAVVLGAAPHMTPRAIQLALERLQGQLPLLSAHHLALSLHAAALLGVRPYRSWMAEWQQQLLRQGHALSCIDSVRVVCSLAILHPPSTKLGDPVTAVLVDRLNHHVPVMTGHQMQILLAAIHQLYRRLRGRPLQRLVGSMQDRLRYVGPS